MMRSRFGKVLGVATAVAFVLGLPVRGEARMRAGVELGLNYSSLSYDDLTRFPQTIWDPGWRPSFTGGATLQIPIRGQFGLVTGLRYVQQGNRVTYNDPAQVPPLRGEFRIYQDYVSVPALLTFHLSGAPRLFLSAGPEVAFLVAAHGVIDQSSPPLPSKSTDHKDSMNSVNVTLDAATGYEFPVEQHVGTVSLRYAHGVTGVAKEGQWGTDWQTRGVEFLVGLRW